MIECLLAYARGTRTQRSRGTSSLPMFASPTLTFSAWSWQMHLMFSFSVLWMSFPPPSFLVGAIVYLWRR
ncbi:hypothetical protein BGY98DRAFT_982719 [Russula aff. rugulosa BPL654]|nr:hypothetical protein BGY98DRAFT_982719 [Russula aff. rugulosa BPL654]